MDTFENLEEYEAGKIYIFKMRPFRGTEKEIKGLVEKVDTETREIIIYDLWDFEKRKIYEPDVMEHFEFIPKEATSNSTFENIKKILLKNEELLKIDESINKLESKKEKIRDDMKKIKKKALMDRAIKGEDAKSVAAVLNDDIDKIRECFNDNFITDIRVCENDGNIELSFSVVRKFNYNDKWDSKNVTLQCASLDLSSIFDYAEDILETKETGYDENDFGVGIAYTNYKIRIKCQGVGAIKTKVIKSLKETEKARKNINRNIK